MVPAGIRCADQLHGTSLLDERCQNAASTAPSAISCRSICLSCRPFPVCQTLIENFIGRDLHAVQGYRCLGEAQVWDWRRTKSGTGQCTTQEMVTGMLDGVSVENGYKPLHCMSSRLSSNCLEVVYRGISYHLMPLSTGLPCMIRNASLKPSKCRFCNLAMQRTVANARFR